MFLVHKVRFVFFYLGIFFNFFFLPSSYSYHMFAQYLSFLD